MLSVEGWMDIKALHRQGHSIRAIAALTGHARNTVRRVVRQPTPPSAKRRPRRSCLDPYKPYLLAREERCRLSAVRLLEELRPQGYTGSIDVLRRFLKEIRTERRTQAKMTVRFETPPGQQAQADWAYVGRFPAASGQTIPIYCFAIVLSFSRLLAIEFTTDMRLPTLIRCHLNAFAAFAGVPHSILYDNMKQVKLAPGAWNPLFLDFCGHYGLVPTTHRIRRPRTKGKVERVIAYVEDNFLNGRTFTDLADLNAQGQSWLAQTANVRIHATTQARPVDLWQQERAALLPLAHVPPYQLAEHHERKVDVEGFVRLARSRYSVPPEFIGKQVVATHQEQRVVIRCGAVIIAEHPCAPHPGACMAHPAHLEALARQSVSIRHTPAHTLMHVQAMTVATTPLAVYEEIGA